MTADEFTRIAGIYEQERDDALAAKRQAEADMDRAELVVANLQAQLDHTVRLLDEAHAERDGLQQALADRLDEAAGGRAGEVADVSGVYRDAARLIRS